VWGTGRIADKILGLLTVLFFFSFFVIPCRSGKNSNLSNGLLVPSISWEGQKALNVLCYLAMHIEL